MEQLNSIKEYLTGDKFSSSLKISFVSERFSDESRINKLLELTRDSRVIHLGFADHIPLIKDKIATKVWLHGLLDENCEECYGVDICQEAVDFVKNELGYQNICCANILEDDILKDKQGKWDYLLLGEILEHVDNPVLFLQIIKNKYKDKIGKIIITVPNIFNIYMAHCIKNNIEHINTDHRYWFTPFTILKVLTRAGFYNAEICLVNRCLLGKWDYAKRKIKKMLGLKVVYPVSYFDTILVVSTF